MTTSRTYLAQRQERARKVARARSLVDPLGAKGFRRTSARIERETRARRGVVAIAVTVFLACFGLIVAQGAAQSGQATAPPQVAEVTLPRPAGQSAGRSTARAQQPRVHVRTRAS